jgi:BatD DUF11 like domain
MVKRVHCLFLAIGLLLQVTALQAAVQVSVAPREIDIMQSTQLQVRVTGTDDVHGLDLTPLNADFEVETTSTQSQLRVVNGEVTSWVDLLITLRPKRTGQLTIPSLSLGGERSDPVVVTVRPVASNLQNEIDKLVYFDISVDRSDVYVQAQVRYTRRLYYTAGVQIYGDLPGAPVIPDAVVLPLGETTQDITMRHDTRYGVLEQRYAIFPERSGQFTIPGFAVQSSVRLNEVRRGVQVMAADKTINVLPIPASWPAGKPWFPVSDLTIREQWDPDVLNIQAGASLRRMIEITANGNTGSSIPPPTTTVDSELIRQYPEAPVLEDDTRGDAVNGKRVQSDNFVPAWGGTVEIPGVDISWWDTETKRVRLTRLPARALNISGEKPPVSTPRATSQDEAISPSTINPTQDDPAFPVRWWPTLVTVLLALTIFTILRFRPGQTSSAITWPAAARRAIHNNDLHGLREAIIHGAMLHHAVRRSEALDLLATEPEWQILQASGNQRFATNVSAPDLTRAMQDSLKLVRRLNRTKTGKTRAVLPPLYAR